VLGRATPLPILLLANKDNNNFINTRRSLLLEPLKFSHLVVPSFFPPILHLHPLRSLHRMSNGAGLASNARNDNNDNNEIYDDNDNNGEEDDGEVVDPDFLAQADQVIELDDDEFQQEGGEFDENDMEEEIDDSAVIAPTRDDSVRQFSRHNEQPIYALAISPNSQLIVSGGGDDRAYLWQANNPDACLDLGAHGDSVVSVAFNFNGTLVATGGMDGVVRVLETTNGTLKLTLEGPSREIEFVQFHPQGNVVLVGSADSTAWMWDANDGSVLAVLSGHQDTVSCGNFTSNGRRLLTGSIDGTLKVWEPTGALVHTFNSSQGYHTAGVVCLGLHPDGGPNIATGGEDGTACIVRLDSKKVISRFAHTEAQLDENDVSVEGVAFCPSMPWLATAGTDARVLIWDLHAGAKRVVLSHGAAVVGCIWIKAETRLVTACADALLRVWDGRTGALTRTFEGHTDAILDMTVANNGSMVVSGGDDGVCRVFAL